MVSPRNPHIGAKGAKWQGLMQGEGEGPGLCWVCSSIRPFSQHSPLPSSLPFPLLHPPSSLPRALTPHSWNHMPCPWLSPGTWSLDSATRHSEISLQMNTPTTGLDTSPLWVLLWVSIPESWSSGDWQDPVSRPVRLRTSPWTGRCAEEVDAVLGDGWETTSIFIPVRPTLIAGHSLRWLHCVCVCVCVCVCACTHVHLQELPGRSMEAETWRLYHSLFPHASPQSPANHCWIKSIY